MTFHISHMVYLNLHNYKLIHIHTDHIDATCLFPSRNIYSSIIHADNVIFLSSTDKSGEIISTIIITGKM